MLAKRKTIGNWLIHKTIQHPILMVFIGALSLAIEGMINFNNTVIAFCSFFIADCVVRTPFVKNYVKKHS